MSEAPKGGVSGASKGGVSGASKKGLRGVKGITQQFLELQFPDFAWKFV